MSCEIKYHLNIGAVLIFDTNIIFHFPKK